MLPAPHYTLPSPTTTPPPTTPSPVRSVCRNELKQPLVNHNKKKSTHTPSATCQRRFLKKKPATDRFAAAAVSPLSVVILLSLPRPGLGRWRCTSCAPNYPPDPVSERSANTSSPMWQQGGVLVGGVGMRGGLQQHRRIYFPTNSLNPLLFPDAHELAMLKLVALSNTGSFRRLRLVCSSSSPCTCSPRYRECNRKCNTLQ